MELGDLRSLIDAAGASDHTLAAVVSDIGAEAVASVLLKEMAERADGSEPADSRPVTVRFELTFGASTVSRRLQIGVGAGEPYPGSDPDAQVTVFQDLLDLARGVYGPNAMRRNSTRRIVWDDQTPISKWSEVPRTAPAMHRLLSGTAPETVDLAGLMLRLGSDKWGLHYYTEHYQTYLRHLRDSPVVLVEIGIGGFDVPNVGGGSLRAWSRYLHRAVVCGVDIENKTTVPGQRIRTFRGDQADPDFLRSVVRETGSPDVVVDDGSHRSSDVTATFRALFPMLRSGGVYIVEDLQTSYWPRFGGSSSDLSSDRTSMGFLKGLVDGLNHEEISRSSGRGAADTDTQISGLHFHHNLAVVMKGRNEEGSLPEWHPARAK
uniref:Sugar O-methyltransferase n=1 Tax=uncultured bacterium BAC-AB1442/1414/561 TaxID=1562172 RepID=A0A0C4S6F8_9BACT|nr:sugar O-methyltransferase [uncultured bacterium BAC-AB1442/1414/561]